VTTGLSRELDIATKTKLDCDPLKFYICSPWTPADPHVFRLSEMSQCACRLGMAFGAEAERAQDAERRLEYFRLFDRCFFAVRVATALELRLARMPVASRDEALTDREDLADRDEAERPERDDSELERAESNREREREVEPASLPLLLGALEGVAIDAAALDGPEPAALPTLRELLAHVTSVSPAVSAARAGPAANLKARLAGSGAATALQLAPAPSRAGSASVVRRATGPPRR
jgi:hypothetical protein